MSKFLPQKKKLIEDVFEKASNETTEKSFSGILKSLELRLLEDLGIRLSYKTFETYYNDLVENDKDYNIKPMILDELSNYLGYNNFKEYCAEWKTVEYSVKESISKVVINIINKPLLKIPEFLNKQSGLGIVGVLVLGGFLTNDYLKKDKSEIVKFAETNNLIAKNEIPTSQTPFVIEVKNLPVETIIKTENRAEKKLENYMYWNGESFVATEKANLGSQFEVVPMDENKFRYFKKITTPDTITSIKNIWYSKHQNVVEFFTADGKNPENGKELRVLSHRILEKYGKGE